MKYQPTIGMEVHVELATESKMFCSCRNGMGMDTNPNVNICPVCTGQPGTLPVLNAKAIDFVIKAGLALNCQIAHRSKFDRKNYFYPDLPKGYQISQYDQPLCEKGFLEFDVTNDEGETYRKKVGITRIHLEEDTGKLVHKKNSKETLVDFNRAGVPLMELVTEPDIKNAAEAKRFCEELRLIFRHIGISPADMEKGQMRCEANVSVFAQGQDRLSGTKVELKNLNSFKAVERGIKYEVFRQTGVIEQGDKVVQETRGWNEDKGESFSQREKEESHDYRYFPEPDILPLNFTDEYIDQLRIDLPELPSVKRGRFASQFGLKVDVANIIAANQAMADYFEMTCSELDNWISESGHDFSDQDKAKLYQLTANYLVTEIQRHLIDKGRSVEEIKITPENFAELIKMVYEGEINSSSAQQVIARLFEKGGDPSQIVDEMNLRQTSDANELTMIIDGVLVENEKSVADYQSGKENALKFLIGQVMKKTQGRANPAMVNEIILGKIKN